MKLTILGKYGPWPKAGCACSGYLLEAGGRRLLLDCGCGVLGQLQRHIALEAVDGIILSHLHSDHMGDMMVLRYALPYLMGKGLRRERLPVLLPATPESIAQTILSDGGFDACTVAGGDRVEFLGLPLSFFAVRHPIECNAVRIEAEGKSFVFSGDMNTTPGFEGFASGADALLIDGCFPAAEWGQDKPHLSGELAAQVGQRAGVKRLLLTHLRPVGDDAVVLLEARRHYPAAEIAQDGAAYDI